MKFHGILLSFFIAVVTKTMAAMIMLIFDKLGNSLAKLGTTNASGFNSAMIGGWGTAGQVIPIGIFQLVVGIYVIEVCYLLSVLSNGIENGYEDKISEKDAIGWTILIGLTIYSISLIITYTLFGPTIQMLLAGNV